MIDMSAMAMEARCVCCVPDRTRSISIAHARLLHERIRALEAIAVKDSARAERAEAEVIRLSLEADDFRDDYREELSAYIMSAKRAEARLAETERLLAEARVTAKSGGENPVCRARGCAPWPHLTSDHGLTVRPPRAEDRECGT